jgi:hypothetical protein
LRNWNLESVSEWTVAAEDERRLGAAACGDGLITVANATDAKAMTPTRIHRRCGTRPVRGAGVEAGAVALTWGRSRQIWRGRPAAEVRT